MDYIIALGANLGNPELTFSRTLEVLEIAAGSVLKRSAWIRTEPLVHPESPSLIQGDYLNGAIVLQSELEPEELLRQLLDIEKQFGRDRSHEKIRWGPRTLDLDIIAAGQLIVLTDRLTVPHPQMQHREFVLRPMSEIASGWRHPVLGKSVIEMLQDLEFQSAQCKLSSSM